MTESIIHRGGWAPVVSLAVALFLTLLPMPDPWDQLRPQWLALTIIFWSLSLPDRVGVFWAFTTGIVADVATGALMGFHALTLSLVSYAALELHQRVRIYPLWQQALFVWLLLLLERLLALWMLGATGAPTPTLGYWAPTFVGALLWPWLVVVLRDLGHRAGAL